MDKKAKKQSVKVKTGKNLDNDKEIKILATEDAVDIVADDSVDEDVLKVLKVRPLKPKHTSHKPVVDKHDYVAELERDEVGFDDI